MIGLRQTICHTCWCGELRDEAAATRMETAALMGVNLDERMCPFCYAIDPRCIKRAWRMYRASVKRPAKMAKPHHDCDCSMCLPPTY